MSYPARHRVLTRTHHRDLRYDLSARRSVPEVGGKLYAGGITVSYGTKAPALKTAPRASFTQDSPGVPGTAEEFDSFGSSATSGDLDGDGYADLVVGSYGEDAGAIDNAGSLTVLWGGRDGLSGGAVIKGTKRDQFLGMNAVAGDYDGDGHHDLATESHVHHGPFTRNGDAARTAAVPLAARDAQDGDWTEFRLAAGDPNGDGISDLVVAAELEGDGDEVPSLPPLIQYAAGSRDGLTAAVTLDDTPVRGGWDLALGDLNDDGYDEIVVGHVSTSEAYRKGGVLGVLSGSATGPDTRSWRTIDQNTSGVPGSAEAGDEFGSSIAVGDADGDGYTDLAVRAPGEDVGAKRNAGSVLLLRGSGNGLLTAGSRLFTQDTPGIPGTVENGTSTRGDWFGKAVKLVDATRDGRAELVIGTPGENDRGGGVWVLRGAVDGTTGTGSFAFGLGAGLGGSFNR